jgi:putative phage-type endonuclease
MKTLNFEDRDAWLAARRGKITGSRLKDIVVKRGTGKKIGFYELIAERLGVAADDENAMDRGTRLEPEAVERFIKETGKKVDTSLVIWTRDDNESIAVSPDGFIGKKEAVEAKCLSSARHIEAFLTKKVPDEYEMQSIQYFIVNDKLTTLYMIFYDPRILMKDYFVLEVKRADIQDQITEYLAYETNIINEVNEIVNQLTF